MIVNARMCTNVCIYIHAFSCEHTHKHIYPYTIENEVSKGEVPKFITEKVRLITTWQLRGIKGSLERMACSQSISRRHASIVSTDLSRCHEILQT